VTDSADQVITVGRPPPPPPLLVLLLVLVLVLVLLLLVHTAHGTPARSN